MVTVRPALRPVVRSDWPWIQRWFQDPELNLRLGPMDEDWLQHVLQERDGVELVAQSPDGTPFALVGLDWLRPGLVVITDLAVDPGRRGRGLGRQALDAVLAWPGAPAPARWITFVDPTNPAAAAFFVRCGWACDGPDGEMIRYSLPGASRSVA